MGKKSKAKKVQHTTIIDGKKHNICPKCNNPYDIEAQPYCTRPECISYKFDKIIFPKEGGMLLNVDKHKYQLRGYPNQQIVDRTATVKRTFIATIYALFRLKYLLPLLALAPKKKLLKIVGLWVEDIYIADYRKHELKREHFAQSSRELLRVFEKMCGGRQEWFYCLVMIWEHDFAYRYRGQDILTHLNKAQFNRNPRKELMRLIGVGMQREKAQNVQYDTEGREMSNFVKGKMQKVGWLLSALMLISPYIKRLAREFFNELNVEEIKMNINDIYWTAREFGYDYQGKPFAERNAWREGIDREWAEELAKRAKANPQPQANIEAAPQEAKKPQLNINLPKQIFNMDEDKVKQLVEGVKANILNTYYKGRQQTL